MEVKQIKCGKVRDGFDALTSLCEKEAQKLCTQLDIQLFVKKKRKSFVLNLTFNPILRLKYHFGQKISRNLSVLGNSLRMRTEISLLYWIIQNPHFNKILNDSPLSCVSNPILKSPPTRASRRRPGSEHSRNYAGVLASKKR